MRSAHPLIKHRRTHVVNAAKLPRPSELKAAAGAVRGVNAKTAVVVPEILGSMPFFWFCLVLTLCSLPAVLTAFDSEVLKGVLGLSSFFPGVILKVSLISLVAWVAQTFIQLVALPVLQVSGNATQAQLEGHVAIMLDKLDTETEGGLGEIRQRLEAIETALKP